jgi:hypothetical protein
MYITLHAKIRYTQRFFGIEDENAAFEFIRDKKNEAKVLYGICKAFETSKRLATAISPNDDGANLTDYFLSGTTLLVVDRNEHKVITLYNILDSDVEEIKKLVTILNKNQNDANELMNKKKKIDIRSRKIEDRVEYLEQELSRAKEELSVSVEEGMSITCQLRDARAFLRNSVLEVARFGKKRERKVREEVHNE